MPPLYALLYVGFCALIALAGRRLPPGFIAFFLISIFLSPVTGLILLILMVAYARTNKAAPAR
jgi:hypothetical protein